MNAGSESAPDYAPDGLPVACEDPGILARIYARIAISALAGGPSA